MGFNISMPQVSTVLESYKKVWQKGDFIIYDTGDDYILYKSYEGKLYWMAYLREGKSSLSRYYKNDFSVWVSKMWIKDIHKCDKLRKAADDINKQCDFIQILWNI